MTLDTAEVVDFPRGTVFIGEDHLMEFEILTSAGVAVDISGWAMEWILRDSHASGIVMLQKSTAGSSITLTDPTNGKGQFLIADTDTASFPEMSCCHSLRRTDAGLEKVLAWGELYLTMATAR